MVDAGEHDDDDGTKKKTGYSTIYYSDWLHSCKGDDGGCDHNDDDNDDADHFRTKNHVLITF